MSYLVLARKWRPQTFDEVLGQKPVVRTLQNALKKERVAHAMLFSGVRGVGKTTLARIMAKAMNCQNNSERPCCRCQSCHDITEGISLDLHEIDGASNRGIQEIRELKENIRFLPARNPYKIIIIDEVHMLTTEAFNALLKTLEEPPDHVYFMLATTEIHKIPVTILSRCQRYELRRIATAELTDFFRKVASKEGVKITEAAVNTIAREAEGSVRDGLSLLDQVFSFGGSEVRDDDVLEVLGVVDQGILLSLAALLFRGELPRALHILDQCFNAGVDLKRFANDLLLCFRSLIICKMVDNPSAILDMSEEDLKDRKKLAAAYSPQTLYQYFQLILKGIENLQYSAQPRLSIEMLFIRAAQVGEITPISSLLERIEKIMESDNGEGVRSEILGEATQHLNRVVTESVPASREEKESEDDIKVTKSERLANIVEKETPQSCCDSGREQSMTNTGKDVKKDWDEFIAYVLERKRWMAHALRSCTSVMEKEGKLSIKFDSFSDLGLLQESDNVKSLTEFAQDFFQKGLVVTFSTKDGYDIGSGDSTGPKPQEERRALANDQLVQIATEIFGGSVKGIRTGPRSR